MNPNQLVGEVLEIMRKNGVEVLPVYLNGRCIEKLHLADLLDFLNLEVNGINIYHHKLHFDLESALIVIRDRKVLTGVKEVSDNFETFKKRQQKVRLFSFATIAAALMLVSACWFLNRSINPLSEDQAHAKVIKNSSLDLGHGQFIDLDSAKMGTLIEAEFYRIVKDSVNRLTYHLKPGVKRGAKIGASHVLSVAKGKQYAVRLSDGTQIWLNAASSIQFPVSFAGLKERRVELSGEAYFAVVHDEKQPFRAYTSKQVVEDIGTEFSIRAYDHEAVSTSLIEGSAGVYPVLPGSGIDHALKLGKGVILTKGWQSVLSKNGISRKQMETDGALGWKNGEFNFQDAKIADIMGELSRWYDVDVVYENKEIRNEKFGGIISRSESLAGVLKVIALTGDLHFEIKGRKVFVK